MKVVITKGKLKKLLRDAYITGGMFYGKKDVKSFDQWYKGVENNIDLSGVSVSLPMTTDEWQEVHEDFVTAMKIDESKTTYEHLQNSFYWFMERFGGNKR